MNINFGPILPQAVDLITLAGHSFYNLSQTLVDPFNIRPTILVPLRLQAIDMRFRSNQHNGVPKLYCFQNPQCGNGGG